MKKSKIVGLVLITAVLASCNKHEKKNWDNNDVYMRSDDSAPYNQVQQFGGVNAFMWYYAFRPYGMYYGGSYHHSGYYSSGLSESSNIGHSSTKSSAMRGGFGGSSRSFSVSS